MLILYCFLRYQTHVDEEGGRLAPALVREGDEAARGRPLGSYGA
jgi:hypothetical protein